MICINSIKAPFVIVAATTSVVSDDGLVGSAVNYPAVPGLTALALLLSFVSVSSATASSHGLRDEDSWQISATLSKRHRQVN